MINVTIQGDSEIRASLEAMPHRVHDLLLTKMQQLALLLRDKVQNDKLSGGVLNVRTGNLRRSIFDQTDDGGNVITSTVGSSGDVKYAAIHEFGGKTAAHDILPDKAKALAFMMGGKQVFAKIVHHPGSQMPERSFLRSSLDDLKDDIVAGIRAAVQQGMAT